jgi:hypothetical protein
VVAAYPDYTQKHSMDSGGVRNPFEIPSLLLWDHLIHAAPHASCFYLFLHPVFCRIFFLSLHLASLSICPKFFFSPHPFLRRDTRWTCRGPLHPQTLGT